MRLTQDWTEPRCKHASSKTKGRLKLSELSHVVCPLPQCQQGYESPKCCRNICELFSFCFLKSFVFPATTCVPCLQIISKCDRVEVTNRKFVHLQTFQTAENEFCLSFTCIQQVQIFQMFSSFLFIIFILGICVVFFVEESNDVVPVT